MSDATQHANRSDEAAKGALGQKQTLSDISAMSALPPKADIDERDLDVRFVPKAGSCAAANISLFRAILLASATATTFAGRRAYTSDQ
jgi:hypothetical protein